VTAAEDVVPDQSADAGSLPAMRQRIAARIVGRRRELDLLLAATSAGRDIVLEGPPGTSKTTLLRAITAEWETRSCSSRAMPTSPRRS
jgi:MoxR-like ATPase